jgi:phosphate transport system permease protein
MTDTPATTSRAVDHSSAAAKRRLAKRYRAEARFRSYGVIGLILTALFIAILILDVAVKGLPAFWQHSLVLDVGLDAATLDPQGRRDPQDLARADFDRLIRDELARLFPQVTTRAGRRLLLGLLSAGAAEELRNRVVSDPSLVGDRIAVRALLSDDADLYLKGAATNIARRLAKGSAVLLGPGDGERFDVMSTAGDFAESLAEVKRRLAARADALDVETKRLRDQRASFEAQLRSAGAADAAQRMRLEGNLTALDSKIAELEGQAAPLRARASNSEAPETLDPTLPSVLAEVQGGLVKGEVISRDRLSGHLLAAPASQAPAAAGAWRILTYETPEASRKLSDQEVAWLERLRQENRIDRHFNTRFFTAGDSREPELAGIRGALVGSFLTLLVTLVLCLPIGVAAALYLEEFAVRNRVTEIIEVNINNLAAVPSIIFGLLGLALFLNTFGLPRSAALVGGLVLALLVLPTIIIASRAALKAVPPSVREAALAIGASHQQAVFHHVLPLAMPGIMTGTIIGMAHALGETAPLLMIGMVAFIVDVPAGVTDSATVLPVQIFLWSDLPELAFQAKTAAAIIVLLGFLFVMNGAAILLRRRFERRW